VHNRRAVMIACHKLIPQWPTKLYSCHERTVYHQRVQPREYIRVFSGSIPRRVHRWLQRCPLLRRIQRGTGTVRVHEDGHAANTTF
jgi:hypothetical protein